MTADFPDLSYYVSECNVKTQVDPQDRSLYENVSLYKSVSYMKTYNDNFGLTNGGKVILTEIKTN